MGLRGSEDPNEPIPYPLSACLTLGNRTCCDDRDAKNSPRLFHALNPSLGAVRFDSCSIHGSAWLPWPDNAHVAVAGWDQAKRRAGIAVRRINETLQPVLPNSQILYLPNHGMAKPRGLTLG